MTHKAAPLYEIYALKYAGPVTSKLALLLWMEGWDEEVERNYYIWAIKGADETIIVDTGCGSALAKEKGLPYFSPPIQMLSTLGIGREVVKKIVVTHLHFDHAGGVAEFARTFPDAVFYIQKREYDFWITNPLSKRRPFARFSYPQACKEIARLQDRDRLMMVKGDKKIGPGIELLLSPGHTMGLQAMAVNTTKGTVILASDFAHIKRNLEDGNPSSFVTDMAAWLKSNDKLRSKTSPDLIFSGHDVSMFREYEEIAPGVTKLA
jgi:glyoxylase-like metal-dependent hydrolase (beta-lactamase superfamily II)